MQRSTFKVLFYVKRQSEKSGQVPIMGRITINGTMSQFSCKLTVRSSLWDAKANKASGKSLEAQRINEKLENVILFIFRLLYINKIIITTPCKRNRIETRSVF